MLEGSFPTQGSGSWLQLDWVQCITVWYLPLLGLFDWRSLQRSHFLPAHIHSFSLAHIWNTNGINRSDTNLKSDIRLQGDSSHPVRDPTCSGLHNCIPASYLNVNDNKWMISSWVYRAWTLCFLSCLLLLRITEPSDHIFYRGHCYHQDNSGSVQQCNQTGLVFLSVSQISLHWLDLKNYFKWLFCSRN